MRSQCDVTGTDCVFGRVVSLLIFRTVLPMKVEARGVEPLSSSPSARTSTRLSGENSEEPSHAPAHCQLPSVHEIDSRTGAVAPPIRQPAVHVFAVSRRHCENVAAN